MKWKKGKETKFNNRKLAILIRGGACNEICATYFIYKYKSPEVKMLEIDVKTEADSFICRSAL